MKEYQAFPVRSNYAYTQSIGPYPGSNMWSSSILPAGGSPYPGLGTNFIGGGASPFSYSPQAAGAAPGGSFNMEQFKGIFNRLGGLDGILGTMTKVNKIVQSFQQMSPLIKLMVGSFLGGAKVKTVTEKSGKSKKSVRKGSSRSGKGRKTHPVYRSRNIYSGNSGRPRRRGRR